MDERPEADDGVEDAPTTSRDEPAPSSPPTRWQLRAHKRSRIKAYRKQSKANARALRQAAYRAWNDPEWRAKQNERRAQLIALGAIQPRKSEMNRENTA